jgi:hypothetical protein
VAARAGAEHIDQVARRLETVFGRQAGELATDHVLERRRRCHIQDLTAGRADQVVVVLGQMLIQLEAREFVAGGDTPHHAGTLQVDEMAVRGAAGESGEGGGDVGDADRMAGLDEEIHDGPAPARVALVDATEPTLDEPMKVVGGLGGAHSPRQPTAREATSLNNNETVAWLGMVSGRWGRRSRR